MTTYLTSRLTAAALAIPLLLGALTACGTSDDTPDTGGGTGSDTSSQSFDDYQLAFASCMRDQGVDMPDPNSDGSIEAQAGDGFMEAAEACQAELGEPPAAPGAGPQKSEEEQRAEWLKIAACFRDNGHDVPDPGPGESITIPMDAPEAVLEECVPEGIGGSTGAGGN
ncbi:hypothetical protein [Promicromonospora sp. NPDC023987]|uniref:hypothetical protein n=1 Tax=Promicromonospora sp. NPDC023987 TaxID=3155360 RepID=UPI0033DD2022